MHPGSHPLHRPIEALLARHEREPEHARQVARLALELHDTLRPIHGQGARERELLECAALLHDIGWSATAPDGKGHHKASARLIRESTWETLTQREVRCVAAVARYHRKALPDPEHEDLRGLPATDQTRVAWMAACLRTADGLDRRHLQAVDSVSARRAGGGIELRVVARGGIDDELAAADRKSDLLRSLLPGPLTFRRVDPTDATPQALPDPP
jgi:exopolyphosphatase/guanosine-5'-triphosphate,3'-diphosphate pyrophosphatase